MNTSYSLRYELENDVTSKAVTINDVKPGIATDTTAVAAFGDDLTAYFEGDYTIVKQVAVTKIETEIELD